MQSEHLPYNTEVVYRVASRNSSLALKQVEEIASRLPGLKYAIVPVQSFGDKNKHISLINNTISDIFTRELDHAILNDEADIAIHSAKDLPYPIPEGLRIIALTEAFDKSDSLVTIDGKNLMDLPLNPKIGTSSLLRKAELLKIRPDIQIISIRGTIEERIGQVDKGLYDGVIVATCALKRLGLETRIAEVLPFDTHPLQGNLAVIAKADNYKAAELFKPIDIRTKYGKVWLVGFGPGDPDLLTIKGFNLLKHANLILYDDLTNHRFIDQFNAKKLYVGKRKNNHSFEQDEINKLLFQAAVEGKNVVRLKGGDPMVFGHGGEELQYLSENLVEVNVVPGITTALAAAANAGVPLTHRNISSSVTFITGHSPDTINVPKKGTVVIYMGASHIKSIADKAIENGRDSNTPVLLAHNVTQPTEEFTYTTLKQLSTSDLEVKTPLIIVIGEVVQIRPNRKAIKTAPVYLATGTKADFIKPVEHVIHNPMIEIRALHESEYPNLSEYINTTDIIIFTSRHTVRYFFEILTKQGKDTRSLGGLRVVSIGRKTSAELLKYGIVADLQPKLESSEGVLDLFVEQNITNARVFIPRSDLALPIIPEGLAKLGNTITTTIIYKNNKPQHVSIPSPDKFDIIVFSSPSGVDNFFENINFSVDNKKFIVRGKETKKRLLEKNINSENILNSESYEALS